MKRFVTLSIASLFVSVACIDAPVRDLYGPPRSVVKPAEPDPEPNQPEIRVAKPMDVVDVEVVPARIQAICSGEESECELGDALGCCAGLFCTAELFVYGPTVCSRPQPVDSFCNDNAQCESGFCIEYTCRAAACQSEGDWCYGETICCEGLFCSVDPNSYGQGSCLPPLQGGEVCQDNTECASSSCVDSVCQAP